MIWSCLLSDKADEEMPGLQRGSERGEKKADDWKEWWGLRPEQRPWGHMCARGGRASEASDLSSGHLWRRGPVLCALCSGRCALCFATFFSNITTWNHYFIKWYCFKFFSEKNFTTHFKWFSPNIEQHGGNELSWLDNNNIFQFTTTISHSLESSVQAE